MLCTIEQDDENWIDPEADALIVDHVAGGYAVHTKDGEDYLRRPAEFYDFCIFDPVKRFVSWSDAYVAALSELRRQ